MRLGVVTNVMHSDEEGATTYRIAAEAVRRGHEVWVTSTGNFCYDPEDHVGALARTVPHREYRSPQDFLDVFNSKDAIERWVTIDELDVLFLRSNPSVQSAWAQGAGIEFGRLARNKGVIVVSDPDGLARATSKLYFQTLPREVRPRTLITRNASKIREFAAAEGTVILKPLRGSGGKSVFILRPTDHANIPEMIRAISRDGYVVAQEYLPLAAEGDTRLFLMNGSPLVHCGKVAAFRRIRTGDDIRSNVHAGGKIRRAEVDDGMLRLAEMVRPRVVEDGLFFVGLDIVGDKLMEINVFSPGGLGSAQRFENVNFNEAVVDSLERKVRLAEYCRRDFENRLMATL